MVAAGSDIATCLEALSRCLVDAAAVAQAAVTCAQRGAEREAIRITMDLDLLLSESQTLHGACLDRGQGLHLFEDMGDRLKGSHRVAKIDLCNPVSDENDVPEAVGCCRPETRRLLARIVSTGTETTKEAPDRRPDHPRPAGVLTAAIRQRGTMLMREWQGRMARVRTCTNRSPVLDRHRAAEQEFSRRRPAPQVDELSPQDAFLGKKMRRDIV